MEKFYAVIKTNKGDMKAELYTHVAPNTVLNFITLAQKGFYNNLSFHRVIEDFVIQGGCPKGDGTGGPGYSIPAEFNKVKHVFGTLSMARSSHPDSAGSQFFVCLGPQEHLDNNYTAFGQVVEGIEIASKIVKGDVIKSIAVEGVIPDSIKGKELVKSGVR